MTTRLQLANAARRSRVPGPLFQERPEGHGLSTEP